jgi:hypothetical protein
MGANFDDPQLRWSPHTNSFHKCWSPILFYACIVTRNIPPAQNFRLHRWLAASGERFRLLLVVPCQPYRKVYPEHLPKRIASLLQTTWSPLYGGQYRRIHARTILSKSAASCQGREHLPRSWFLAPTNNRKLTNRHRLTIGHGFRLAGLTPKLLRFQFSYFVIDVTIITGLFDAYNVTRTLF